jgi:hypothetical protein
MRHVRRHHRSVFGRYAIGWIYLAAFCAAAGRLCAARAQKGMYGITPCFGNLCPEDYLAAAKLGTISASFRDGLRRRGHQVIHAFLEFQGLVNLSR